MFSFVEIGVLGILWKAFGTHFGRFLVTPGTRFVTCEGISAILTFMNTFSYEGIGMYVYTLTLTLWHALGTLLIGTTSCTYVHRNSLTCRALPPT